MLLMLKSSKWLKYSAYVFAVWALGLILFVTTAYFFKPQEPDSVTDAVVVFTGDQNRIEEAMRLFAMGRTAHLYVSGVNNDVSLEEIKAKWTGDIALPPCCLSLDYVSKNTVQNAQETAVWVRGYKYRVIRLVTSDYHMARALTELRHALPHTKILAHPVKDLKIGKGMRFKPWRVVFFEYHKALYRYVALLFHGLNHD